ncbi:site-specific integrase [Pseudomonas proteolytica]|uniref:site-specific integrase n=1 Tax=Pseudomonas proteolytica TaxID=219574 RepID=UPI0030D8414F
MRESAESESENPTIAAKSVISIHELSAVSDLSEAQVFREILNHNIPTVYEAQSEPGYVVEDYTEVDRESELGGFMLNSAHEIGVYQAINRFLRPFQARKTLLEIIEHGFYEEVAFRVPGQNSRAVFFDLPGIKLTARNMLILKVHAERFFIPQPLKPNAVMARHELQERQLNPLPSPSSLACECCRPERGGQLTSSLMKAFLDRKEIAWGLDQQKKMETHCKLFVELMDDPPLGALNRDLIWAYADALRRMPANRYNAARHHGTNDAKELLALADEHGEERISSGSALRYMDALSSMFSWAVDNMMLTHNPAKRAIEKSRKITRDQDSRSRFEQQDLDRIFSARWFSNGIGERNAQGRFHQFRPHFYWLPLLALYTGARLNELSQLYLGDIRISSSGVHYLDFNLDAPDKLDVDSNDKSLKTVNSQRIVPLHPHLVELGLHAYAEALRIAGYTRLFPELKRDAIKGYGKPAGSWFNERFLGKQLGMERNGTRTFHSFRHTFITALSELEVPSDIQSQLAGHSRGETITTTRYRKDAEADRLLSYVKQLDFKLTPIRAFIIVDGLHAVKDAMRRKIKPTYNKPLSN